jgi:hypothetical protein
MSVTNPLKSWSLNCSASNRINTQSLIPALLVPRGRMNQPCQR